MSTTLLNYNEICVRYARALIKIFKNASEQNKCLKMYKKLLDLKKKSSLFENFLLSPMIPINKKMNCLNKLHSKLKIEKNLFNFLCVLCKHNRLFALEMIYSKVDDIIKKKNNTVRLDIITTEKIDEQISNKIKHTVSNSMKKDVDINNIIDKSIIGGMILKIDSYMIDGSISTKLANYKNIPKGLI